VAAGKGVRVIKGTGEFMIPLHVGDSDCLEKMDQPFSHRSIGIAALVSLACGAVIAAVFRPDFPGPATIFVIFSGIAGVFATVYLKIKYPPYLVIWDKTDWNTYCAEYEADFRDEACAAAFADLNRDILRPWTRPKWLDPFLRWR
jgi:hypothetical protein